VPAWAVQTPMWPLLSNGTHPSSVGMWEVQLKPQNPWWSVCINLLSQEIHAVL
jgi:hypothetical protein